MYTTTGVMPVTVVQQKLYPADKLFEKRQMHAQGQDPSCSVPSVAHVARKEAPPIITQWSWPAPRQRLVSAKRRTMEACVAGLAEAAHQHAAAQAGLQGTSGNGPFMLHPQRHRHRLRPHPDQALGAAEGVRVSLEAFFSPF